MNVLIVEDDENKVSQLAQFLKEVMPDAKAEVAHSLQSGLRRIRNTVPDLVLLDMTLPTYDVGPDEPGGDTHPFGGREFLRQIRRFKITVPVIVITQFETFGSGPEATTLKALDDELARNHPDVYRGAVYYHAAIQSWKDQLKKLLSKAADSTGAA
jgi:CheY-like chemotaxis protein